MSTAKLSSNNPIQSTQGTNAPISILVADSISSAVPTDTTCGDDPTSEDCDTIVQATLTLSVMCGFLYFIFYVCRFGVVTAFVPDPVLAGFTTGASVIIMTSNMKHVFGFPVPNGTVVSQWTYILKHLNETNLAALAIFSLAFFTLFAIKNLNGKLASVNKLPMGVPIPEQLVVLLLAIAAAYIWKIDTPIVGTVPSGLYEPRLPDFDWELVGKLVKPSIVCSVVTYILTVNISKVSAAEVFEVWNCFGCGGLETPPLRSAFPALGFPLARSLAFHTINKITF